MIPQMIINIDGQETKFADDVSQWYPLKAENCDSILAVDVLQFFDFEKVLYILNDWHSKLKIGGTLEIIARDFREVALKYTKGERINVLEAVYGRNRDYKSVFDKESLYKLMQASGFEIETIREDDAGFVLIKGKKVMADKFQKAIDKKVIGLLSVPRLNFSFNRGLLERISRELNMPSYSYEGVFWGQTLTRAIEMNYKDADYILTMDYDSWFTKQHIIKLIQLAEQNLEADAIIPIQFKRRDDSILAGINGKVDKGKVQISISEFKKPLLPVITGHFGLTLFRAKVFETLKKPWFLSQPDKNGGWDEGRLDEDIYFWHNFNHCGFKLFLATEVYVGHTDLMVAFAGLPENNFKPVYINIDKIETELPAHCIPLI